MNSNDTEAKFLAWVKDNYDVSIQNALKCECQKSPCKSRAKLFQKLCKVLGEQNIGGMRHPVRLNEIKYNS